MKIPLVQWLKMRGRKMTKEEHTFIQFGDTDLSSVDFRAGNMTMEQWEKERDFALLIKWLREKHPATLELWEGKFAKLIDLEDWLREYRKEIYQKYQACLEAE